MPVRIIPACAGQTHRRHARRLRAPDHPRLCGANAQMPLAQLPYGGSSPLVRGKLFGWVRDKICSRIIPACAGQTCRSTRTKPQRADHPRLCGANQRFLNATCTLTGSSPLVRGKLDCMPLTVSCMRIIPACAGQTAVFAAGFLFGTDHPRLCGANVSTALVFAAISGSSPLVRGKHERADVGVAAGRIIPACAGQTRIWRSPASR